MIVEINYLNKKLITEVNEDLKVKDLVQNLSEYFKIGSSDFILFDNNNHKLKETDIFPLSENEKIIIYLIKSTIKEKLEKINNTNLNGENNISQLIMECTGAKKPLEKYKYLPFINRGITSIFELFENGNNEPNYFDPIFSFNIISEENGHGNRRRNRRDRFEANGRLLRELQDMGFPEERARQALISSRNNIQRATEILLGMRE